MSVVSSDGTTHYGYVVNDGRGEPDHFVAVCEYTLRLRGLERLSTVWRLDECVATPVNCLQCLGLGGFADAHSRFR